MRAGERKREGERKSSYITSKISHSSRGDIGTALRRTVRTVRFPMCAIAELFTFHILDKIEKRSMICQHAFRSSNMSYWLGACLLTSSQSELLWNIAAQSSNQAPAIWILSTPCLPPPKRFATMETEERLVAMAASNNFSDKQTAVGDKYSWQSRPFPHKSTWRLTLSITFGHVIPVFRGTGPDLALPGSAIQTKTSHVRHT